MSILSRSCSRRVPNLSAAANGDGTAAAVPGAQALGHERGDYVCVRSLVVPLFVRLHDDEPGTVCSPSGAEAAAVHLRQQGEIPAAAGCARLEFAHEGK